MNKKLNDWYSSLLTNALYSLRNNSILDNFDVRRFGAAAGREASEFRAGDRGFYFHWFFENAANLFKARSLLSDQKSIELFDALVKYRLVGHTAARIPVEFSLAEEEDYLSYEERHSNPSSWQISGQFGAPRHIELVFEGAQYVVDCYSLSYYLHRRQYYFSRIGYPAVCPEPGDIVIDAGACLGDTAAVFSNSVGAKGRVISLDPVADHVEFLLKNVGQFPYKNVSVHGVGLGDKRVAVEPVRIDKHNPGFKGLVNGSICEFPLIPLDALVADEELPRIDYIKLDVEGSELSALNGAIETVRKWRPKIAVSLYHRPNDLFSLPIWLSTNFPNYEYYLGHYTIHNEETVLYCRPMS